MKAFLFVSFIALSSLFSRGVYANGIYHVTCDLTTTYTSGQEFTSSYNGTVDGQGPAISQDVSLGFDLFANLHVYFSDQADFLSINLFHKGTGVYLNTDSYVQLGKSISLAAKGLRNINDMLDLVHVKCSVALR